MALRWAWSLGALALVACGDDAGESTPLSAEVIADVTYAQQAGEPASALELDIYTPGSSGDRPVVVLLHGGGATKDDEGVAAVSRSLAESGLVVFVPTHAAAGSSPPDLIADGGRRLQASLASVQCALRYASEHGGDHGGDPAGITIVGHSAGGFLGLIATLGGARLESDLIDLAAGDSLRCASQVDLPSVSGFAGYNGAYFIFTMSGLAESDPALWALADPRRFADAESVPVRLLLGANDEQTPAWHVEEVRRFSDELDGQGVDVVLTVIEDGVHNWKTADPTWKSIRDSIVSLADST